MADVQDGYISDAKARQVYGVVLGDDGAVDMAATTALRQTMLAAVVTLEVVHCEDDPYRGQDGKHRVVRLCPTWAAEHGFADGDLVEMLGALPAPLRAWVEIDAQLTESTLPLDTRGQRMLGVASGDHVELRCLRPATQMPTPTRRL